MSNLLIRDMPPVLKDEISKAANSNGRSMSEEVKFRLRRDSRASAQSAPRSGADVYDQTRAVMQRIFSNDGEVDEFERAIEDERKNDFGRPPPDFE